MDSATKNHLSETKIRELVSANFKDTDVVSVQELNGGMFNSAYRLRLRRGKSEHDTVLKVSPAADADLLTYEKDAMRAEIFVYGLLESKGLPIPRILASDMSRTRIDSDYFFMSTIEGARWDELMKDLTTEDSARLKRELGRYNATIHTVKGDWFGYIKEDAAFRFDSWSKAFRHMIEMILGDGERQGDTLPYESIRGALERSQPLFDEVETPTLVDYDLWAGNVFLQKDDSGYRISGIIDFERAFFGDPLADFAGSVAIYENVEQEEAFRQGYSEVSGQPLVLSDNERIRLRFYHLYMSLLLSVESYRYGPEPAKKIKAYLLPKIEALLSPLV